MSAQPAVASPKLTVIKPAMKPKYLPPWIALGGFLLTLGAGCINAVGWLGLGHQAITHLTGTLTLVGTQFARNNLPGAFNALCVVFFFFIGCVVSSYTLRETTLKLGRRYGAILTGEAALLFLAVWYLNRGSITGDYLASTACGLQNGMATTYSGAIVRTTHMTGIVTDLGIALGHLLRRQPVEWIRVRLHLSLLVGFTLGGIAGALLFNLINYNALLVPGVVCGACGVIYMVKKHRERQKHNLWIARRKLAAERRHQKKTRTKQTALSSKPAA
ncbi:DUF1275 domain-containing protein [Opitutaceae bacterium TAV4]|nr:DUF1275 domain-containing protein [Opitutaceae bacterium TAV4]RRK01940.1 DUF1275 domain-containing protein [Opitutaceae bacterium TAV3]